MLQELLIIALFAGSLFYLGRLIYGQFTAKSNCSSGCGSCGTIDFQKIEKRIQQADREKQLPTS